MIKLLAILLSTLTLAPRTLLRSAPEKTRVAAGTVRRTAAALLTWLEPRLDRLATAGFEALLRSAPVVRDAFGDVSLVLRAIAAQHFDRRIAGSMPLALHSAAASKPILPRPVAVFALACSRLLARSAAAVVARIEWHLRDRFPQPGHARLAAGLLTSSLALGCAGIVGAVSFVQPAPLVRLPAAEAGDVQAAAAPPAGREAPPVETTAAPAPAAAAEPAAEAAAAPTAAPRPAAPQPAILPGEGRGALPIGKGMWIWIHERAEGGDPHAIVERARTWGLTHLYVRTGTLKEGFMAGPFLDRLLPVAHAAGIRVYGWDFPFMDRPGDDVQRALAAIRHTTPDGHRIDGFAPDIETKYEGTNENLEFVRAYVTWLRDNVGPDYPLIAVIPNPTPNRIARGYPFADIIGPFDAVAPMVYWMNREPGADVAHAISFLAQFGKPVFPIGQAYDGAIDGGPPGVPNRDSLQRFMRVADEMGATSVSFWSWQHATGEAWDAIGDAAEFRLGHGLPAEMRPGMIRAYQLQLAYLGYQVPVDGQWSPEMTVAVTRFQTDHKISASGLIDAATRHALLRPRAATVRPAGH